MMNENNMNAFDDEEIKAMYKANAQSSAPDMERLWSRIEASVDAAERNDETLKRQEIKASRASAVKRLGTVAAAVVIVIGAVTFYGIKSANEDHAMVKAPKEDSFAAAVDNSGEQAAPAAEKDHEDSGSSASTAKALTPEGQTSIKINGEDTQKFAELNDNVAEADNEADPFLAGKSYRIVLVKLNGGIEGGKASGWFVDVLGDVYTFEDISVSGGRIYKTLEALIGKEEPVMSADGKTFADIGRLTGELSAESKASSRNISGSDRSYAIGEKAMLIPDTAEELQEIVEEIEEQVNN